MKKAAVFLYFFLFGSMLLSVTALAYIDPSAMTYMIQIAAGAAIAAGAGASYYLRRRKRRFSRRSGGADRAAGRSALDDDDDTGYGDYELDGAQPAPAPAPAAEPVRAAPPPLEESAAPERSPAQPASAAPDPFDETGGAAGLLAPERRNVEELKRALHICTAPRR